MRPLLLAILLFNGVRCTPTTVYICDSPNAIRYHLTQNCKGLRNCSHRIVTVALDKAKSMNLTLCKWER